MSDQPEDEFVGYGEPCMVPTLRRTSNSHTPNSHTPNSHTPTSDTPTSSCLSPASVLSSEAGDVLYDEAVVSFSLLDDLFEECNATGASCASLHCLYQRVSQLLSDRPIFSEQLLALLESSCNGDSVSRAQFMAAVTVTLLRQQQQQYNNNNNSYQLHSVAGTQSDVPPSQQQQHQQDVRQLQHTVRQLQQERDHGLQQLQQLEEQCSALAERADQLSSANTSLLLETERCRHLGAECEQLQTALTREREASAQLAVRARHLQTRVDHQHEEIGQLTGTLDKCEIELADRYQLERQLQQAAELASCQVGELSTALARWRSRDQQLRHTVLTLRQTVRDSEDSVLRTVREKEQYQAELASLRLQLAHRLSSTTPSAAAAAAAAAVVVDEAGCDATCVSTDCSTVAGYDGEPVSVAGSGGCGVSLSGGPPTGRICSIRDEIYQSLEYESVVQPLPLSGISPKKLLSELSLMRRQSDSVTDSVPAAAPGDDLDSTPAAAPEEAPAGDAAAASDGDDDTGVWRRWRSVADTSVTAPTDLSQHAHLTSTAAGHHHLRQQQQQQPRHAADTSGSDLGELVDQLLLLDVSSAASIVVSDFNDSSFIGNSSSDSGSGGGIGVGSTSSPCSERRRYCSPHESPQLPPNDSSSQSVSEHDWLSLITGVCRALSQLRSLQTNAPLEVPKCCTCCAELAPTEKNNNDETIALHMCGKCQACLSHSVSAPLCSLLSLVRDTITSIVEKQTDGRGSCARCMASSDKAIFSLDGAKKCMSVCQSSYHTPHSLRSQYSIVQSAACSCPLVPSLQKDDFDSEYNDIKERLGVLISSLHTASSTKQLRGTGHQHDQLQLRQLEQNIVQLSTTAAITSTPFKCTSAEARPSTSTKPCTTSHSTRTTAISQLVPVVDSETQLAQRDAERQWVCPDGPVGQLAHTVAQLYALIDRHKCAESVCTCRCHRRHRRRGVTLPAIDTATVAMEEQREAGGGGGGGEATVPLGWSDTSDSLSHNRQLLDAGDTLSSSCSPHLMASPGAPPAGCSGADTSDDDAQSVGHPVSGSVARSVWLSGCNGVGWFCAALYSTVRLIAILVWCMLRLAGGRLAPGLCWAPALSPASCLRYGTAALCVLLAAAILLLMPVPTTPAAAAAAASCHCRPGSWLLLHELLHSWGRLQHLAPPPV